MIAREHQMYSPPSAPHAGLWLPPGGDGGRATPLLDRALWTLVAFIVVSGSFAVLRSDVRFAGAPKWFWMEKLTWGADADVVIAGDSRVYRGVDPSVFEEQLGIARNFGFSSAKFTTEFLAGAEAVLDPKGHRVLILGLSAFSLNDGSSPRDGFTEAQRDLARLRLPIAVARALEQWELAAGPIALDAGGMAGEGEASGLARATTDEYAQVFHGNGWVESDRYVADPIANGLAVVRKDYAGETLVDAGDAGRSPANSPGPLAKGLVKRAHELVDRGVTVVAFRVPVPPEVAAEEDRLSGINFGRLHQELEAAGALWVDVPYDGLRSYDGSHLDGESATALSQALIRGTPGRNVVPD